MFEWLKNKYQLRNALVQYGKYYYDNKYALRKLIWYYKSKKKYKIAIWGAGLKGTAFLKIIDADKTRIECVIDINSKNHRKKLITGHTIIPFEQMTTRKIDIVIVMNANHFAEIYMLLKQAGIHTTLVDLDKMIGAKMIIPGSEIVL